jgi:hypothetical protein
VSWTATEKFIRQTVDKLVNGFEVTLVKCIVSLKLCHASSWLISVFLIWRVSLCENS